MSADNAERRSFWPSALPYLVPLFLFLAPGLLADYWPAGRTLLYAVRVLLAGTAVIAYWRRGAYPELHEPLPGDAALLAGLVGVLVIVVWVALDQYYPQGLAEWKSLLLGGGGRAGLRFEHAGKLEAGFDPSMTGQILPPGLALTFRVIGAVLLVPIIEELLFRSWLMRSLVDTDFARVPLGTFTWLSFLATTLVFGLSHAEWLAGIITGAAFALLLYWRRNLMVCVVCHAVANLTLAIWVLMRGAWGFW